MEHALLDVNPIPAPQQPQWDDAAHVRRVRAQLMIAPPLVNVASVLNLRSQLARVAAGEAHVMQAGDCAEDPAESGAADVARKTGLLDVLAGVMKMSTHKPVVRAGRIAGQYGKPRSNPTELCDGLELSVYRGHMVNSPEPDPEGRRPDPRRLLAGYRAASEVMHHLGWDDPTRPGGDHDPAEPDADPGTDVDPRPIPSEPPVWTSHEALLLDYEIPLIRYHDDVGLLLGSTHWPWIGERTRQLDGAHVELLADVMNPVACKVGPGMTVDELLALCERLDPLRDPGRLTLIARMGAEVVGDNLPPLVSAARAAGHPLIWLCDPMHANTVTTQAGVKTRFIDAVVHEVRDFQQAVRDAGGVAGGLHLETTPNDVTECLGADACEADLSQKYTSLCDPRLNLMQAVSVVSAWD